MISRVAVGATAARVAVAAMPTPRSTSAHSPDDTMEAVIRIRVAVANPRPAMAIRVAFPVGRVAQALIAGLTVVIALVSAELADLLRVAGPIWLSDGRKIEFGPSSSIQGGPNRVISTHAMDPGTGWGGG